MRYVICALLCSGCIAASVKAHTGVVADERGRGVQAGVALGIGIAGTKKSAVVETVGFAGGTAPKAGLAIGLDYVRFSEEHDLGWRVGIAGIPLAYGEPAMTGVRVGSLFVVRERYRSGGHEKMWSESTRSVMAVGLEAMVGFSVYDQYEMTQESTFGGAAAVTWEWYLMSRMW